MRIVIWNCMNGMGNPKQIDYFNNLKADIAILPELKHKNIEALNATDAIWMTNNHKNKVPKGLGVLSFGNWKLELLDFDKDMELYIPVKAMSERVTFNLLAVWNFYYDCKQGRFKGAKGETALEWAAVRRYSKQLTAPCLFAGDWNFGPTFSQKAFIRLCNELSVKDLHSLYHKFYGLETDNSLHSTFRTPTKKYHHLDHYFGTKEFSEGMLNYEIPNVDEATLSDHSPIILDVDLFRFGST
jgi:exonuclease III